MCLAGTAATVRSTHAHPPAGADAEAATGRAPARSAAGDDHGAARVSRRGLLGAGLGAAAATLLPAVPAQARRVPARRMADLTHVFADDMPTFATEPPRREQVSGPADPEESVFYDQSWRFPTEHIGTHLDAPGHVVDGGRLAHELAPDDLLVPAVVLDLTAKVAENPNAVVTVEDVAAFERGHGRIPDGAAVLMHSGWAEHWPDQEAYRGGEAFPDLNFPGFSDEACGFLIEQRRIAGVGVDTLSTDPGESTTFPAHAVLAGGGRWGLENLAGLDRMPPRGATLVVGLVPWEEGSGGPCRAFAFW